VRSDTEPRTPDAAEEAATEHAAEKVAEEDRPQVIDLVADELTLARAQLDSGLPMLAEGTARRRIAWLEADRGRAAADEIDAARLLHAEALWRMGRPIAARASRDAIRSSSPQRRLPIALIIEAEALAAAGEPDRAAGLVERVVRAIGADEAWRLRAGAGGRAAWPVPSELAPQPQRPDRAPWSVTANGDGDGGEPDDERSALARARLEAARVALAAGALGDADRELSLALRLDRDSAADALAMLEPTLGDEPAADRLLLYGDLLRATGRDAEASSAYDRAIRPEG
jgi:tetratricopeptide (TPR) repeat protein